MSDPSGRQPGNGTPGDSWEQRAAGLASEVQRWLIKTSAKSVRDDLGGQVRKAFRGQDSEPGDVWGTATTEPPRTAGEAPECAWCPVCRAARRIAEARAAGAGGAGSGAGAGSRLVDAADVMAAAVKEALSGIDSILSYRPGEGTAPKPGQQSPADRPASPADGSAHPADGSAGQADGSAGQADGSAGPADHAASPADHPESPADHPESPADHPESPADHPAGQADGSAGQADGTANPADGTTSPADHPASPAEGEAKGPERGPDHRG